MSLRDELIASLQGIPEVMEIRIFKDQLHHGEPAIQVRVDVKVERDGERRQVMVEGLFTTEQKAAFGGVDFAQRKDIPALMVSKVRAVLAGTAEEVRA